MQIAGWRDLECRIKTATLRFFRSEKAEFAQEYGKCCLIFLLAGLRALLGFISLQGDATTGKTRSLSTSSRPRRGSVGVKRGQEMKKFILTAVAAVALATPALAADKKVAALAAPEAPPNPWDIEFGGGVTSDYIFRGITQSNHKPSVAAYFEPRYNVTKDLQYYVGVS